MVNFGALGIGEVHVSAQGHGPVLGRTGGARGTAGDDETISVVLCANILAGDAAWSPAGGSCARPPSLVDAAGRRMRLVRPWRPADGAPA